MRLAPDGTRPEAVRPEAWNKVPVHMGHHISEKFIINLIRLKEFVKGSRNSGDFFHQLFPGVPVQVEKLRNVPFADDKGIAGKKLIPVENRITEVEFDDPQFRLVIPFRAHRAGFHKLKPHLLRRWLNNREEIQWIAVFWTTIRKMTDEFISTLVFLVIFAFLW
jgi:hypothetical protein